MRVTRNNCKLSTRCKLNGLKYYCPQIHYDEDDQTAKIVCTIKVVSFTVAVALKSKKEKKPID